MADGAVRREGETERGLLGGVTLILVAGLLLGVSYNWFGLRAARPWGLPWIAQDRMAELAGMATVTLPADGPQAAVDPHYTATSDPFAVAGEDASSAELPEIPAAGRPVQIELAAFERYVDLGAALILDARDPQEYREGHIPGALSLPYERAATDPEALQDLEAAGRPVITYCGGGECEVSISLAHELIASGFPRVAVYVGGFPEWQGAGLPIVTGEGTE